VFDTLADLVQPDVAGTVEELKRLGTTIHFFSRIAEVLDRCTGAQTTAALRELSNYAAAEVRLASLEPLVRRLGKNAWPLLESALKDSSAAMRAHAVRTLGSGISQDLARDQARLLAAITRAHVDPDPEVRSRTALALARVGLRGRTRFLLVLESDDDPRVARIARLAREELERGDPRRKVPTR
jgi:HEAT repeat protein